MSTFFDSDCPAPGSISSLRVRLFSAMLKSSRLIPFLFILFVFTVLALYHRGFNSPMILDSQAYIAGNIDRFLAHDPILLISIFPGRILFMLTLYLNFLIGGMEPFSFRVTNSVTLAATGAALVMLIVVVLGRRDCEIDAHPLQQRLIAVMCGLLFVIHPLQLFAVLYIWQGQALMACFFYYCALSVYIYAHSGDLRGQISALVLTGLIFLAGLMTKESVCSLPAVLVLADWLLFKQTRKEFAGRVLMIAVMAASTFLIYWGITNLFTGPETLVDHRGFIRRLEAFYRLSGLGFQEVFLTQCKVIFSYLYRILMPHASEVTLFNVQTIPDHLFDTYATALGVLGTIALLTIGFGLRKKFPTAAFGILFYLTTLAPESFLMPKFMFFSYRAILPMAGILIVLSQVLLTVVPSINTKHKRILAATIFAAAGCYLSFITFSTATNWNPANFWGREFSRLPAYSTRVERLSYELVVGEYLAELGKKDPSTALDLIDRFNKLLPNSSSLSQCMADMLRDRGDFDGAVTNYKKAIELGSSDPAASYYFLGLTQYLQSDLDSAEKNFANAIRLDSRHAPANFALGEIYLKRGNWGEAERLFTRGIEIRPDLAQGYLNRGAALMRLNRGLEAKADFQKAVAMSPDSPKAHANLGMCLLEVKNVKEAIHHLSKAIELDPRMVRARMLLGEAFELSGEPGRAEQEYSKVLELQAGFSEAHLRYASLLSRSGDFPAAIKHFRAVLELDPENYEAHARLGSLCLAESQFSEAIHHLRSALELRPGSPEVKTQLEKALEESQKVLSH